jgi:Cu/Ag efflux protein CusF
MAPWKVVLLLNLALAVGLGWGWLWWGRPLGRLEQVVRTRATGEGEGHWQVQAVVRAVLATEGILVVSHEEIPGVMAPMTMGFRVASPDLLAGLAPGDEVRLTLRGTPPEIIIAAVERPGAGRGRNER